MATMHKFRRFGFRKRIKHFLPITIQLKVKYRRKHIVIFLIVLLTCFGLWENYKESEKNIFFYFFSFLASDVTPVKEKSSFAESCVRFSPSRIDLDLTAAFPTLNFSYENCDWRWWLWSERFETRFKQIETKQFPVQVIAVPFSHNDPVWLEPFHVVANQKSFGIIDNIVNKLTELRSMTFAWTETCLLAHWFHHPRTTLQSKAKLIELMRYGRLEFVGGGWVMPDEALTSTYALVDQLIEGHQWLSHHLNVTPTTSWALDPFGVSSTLPYILRQADIKNTMIVRVHYAWKRFFAENQIADFVWRQSWDGEGTHDVLCHHQPSDLYVLGETIGTDRLKSLEFNFHPGGASTLSVAELADIFALQLRKLASLTSHNVVLLILGEDFGFTNPEEFNRKYDEFTKLFTFINAHSEMNLNIQFGTLGQYFQIIRNIMHETNISLPTASGDFFPYADPSRAAKGTYWTGYFTTRPHVKALGSFLENQLRSAEILFVAAYNSNSTLAQTNHMEFAYRRLTNARQALGLFQHHDAITGTSRLIVMRDLEERLQVAVDDAVSVSTLALQVLLATNGARPSRIQSINRFSGCNIYENNLNVTAIYLFNSLPRHAHFNFQCVVHDQESKIYEVFDHENKRLLVQTTDVSTSKQFVSSQMLHFSIDMPPLSVIRVAIVQMAQNRNEDWSSGLVRRFLPIRSENRLVPETFRNSRLPNKRIVLKNKYLSAIFDSTTGLLVRAVFNNSKIPLTSKMLAYNCGDFSGAYISQSVKVIDLLHVFSGMSHTTSMLDVTYETGSVFSQITASLGRIYRHTARVYHDPGNPLSKGISLDVFLDLSVLGKASMSIESVMQFRTHLGTSKSSFYTDSNGFQMVRRPRVAKLKTEGNYFPITRMAYIENAKSRLSLLVSQPHGAASLRNGWLEVMLDRRIMHDDGRGMNEGVEDNQPHTSRFFLLYESITANAVVSETHLSHPSLLSNHLSDLLNHPALVWKARDVVDSEYPNRVSIFSHSFPCDVHLLSLRTLPRASDYLAPSKFAKLILHRRGVDCHWPKEAVKKSSQCSYSASSVSDIHAEMKPMAFHIKSIEEATLTGSKKFANGTSISKLSQCKVPRMEIRTWTLEM